MDLAELHALSEANYARLLQLFPDYQQANERQFRLGQRLVVYNHPDGSVSRATTAQVNGLQSLFAHVSRRFYGRGGEASVKPTLGVALRLSEFRNVSAR